MISLNKLCEGPRILTQFSQAFATACRDHGGFIPDIAMLRLDSDGVTSDTREMSKSSETPDASKMSDLSTTLRSQQFCILRPVPGASARKQSHPPGLDTDWHTEMDRSCARCAAAAANHRWWRELEQIGEIRLSPSLRMSLVHAIYWYVHLPYKGQRKLVSVEETCELIRAVAIIYRRAGGTPEISGGRGLPAKSPFGRFLVKLRAHEGWPQGRYRSARESRIVDIARDALSDKHGWERFGAGGRRGKMTLRVVAQVELNGRKPDERFVVPANWTGEHWRPVSTFWTKRLIEGSARILKTMPNPMRRKR